MYILPYYLLDHMVKELQNFETVLVLDGILLKHAWLHIERV